MTVDLATNSNYGVVVTSSHLKEEKVLHYNRKSGSDMEGVTV